MNEKFFLEYASLEENIKLEFLEHLLRKEEALQQEFTKFLSVAKETPLDSTTLVKQIHNDFKSFDIDKLARRYNNNYDEYFEYALITKVLTPYQDRAFRLIEQGRYLYAFEILLALYELTLKKTPQIADGYPLYAEAFRYYITTFNKELFENFAQYINTITLHSQEFNSLIEKLLKKQKIYKSYKLINFTSLLEIVTKTHEQASYLLAKIDKPYTFDSAPLLLVLSEKLNDESLFLEIANAYFMHNDGIAFYTATKKLDNKKKSYLPNAII